MLACLLLFYSFCAIIVLLRCQLWNVVRWVITLLLFFLVGRKPLPSCELVFTASEEAIFVHVLVRRKCVEHLVRHSWFWLDCSHVPLTLNKVFTLCCCVCQWTVQMCQVDIYYLFFNLCGAYGNFLSCHTYVETQKLLLLCRRVRQLSITDLQVALAQQRSNVSPTDNSLAGLVSVSLSCVLFHCMRRKWGGTCWGDKQTAFYLSSNVLCTVRSVKGSHTRHGCWFVAVVVAPHGVSGRLSGCCLNDLVTQLHQR